MALTALAVRIFKPDIPVAAKCSDAMSFLELIRGQDQLLLNDYTNDKQNNDKNRIWTSHVFSLNRILLYTPSFMVPDELHLWQELSLFVLQGSNQSTEGCFITVV